MLAAATSLAFSAGAGAETFVVTSSEDPGAGSLRQAVADANALPGADKVTFAAGLAGGDIELVATAPPVTITDPLQITGPGARDLAIDGNDNEKGVFLINAPGPPNPPPTMAVEISGLTIERGTIHGGAIFTGGGVQNIDGDLILRAVDIRDNLARPFGAGVYNAGKLTVVDSLIRENKILAVYVPFTIPGYGAGIFNQNQLIVRNSSIVTNNNGGDDFSAGGAIYLSGGEPGVTPSATISNSSIIGNHAGSGGGLANGSAYPLRIANTLVALNQDVNEPTDPNHDCSGPITSQGYNLITRIDNCTITATTGDQFGTIAAMINPGLAGFGNHGGPVDTWAIEATPAASPALDAGNPDAPADGGEAAEKRRCETTDGRGVPRPQGGRCEIGAFEVVVTPEAVIDSGPGGASGGSTGESAATFEFHATQPGAAFECSLNGGAFEPCTSPKVYSGVTTAGNTFEVRALDPFGNPGPTSSPYEWTYLAPQTSPGPSGGGSTPGGGSQGADTQAPDTFITQKPKKRARAKKVKFGFASSEAGSTFECRKTRPAKRAHAQKKKKRRPAAFAPCVSPRAYPAAGLGRRTFEVRAVDAAGNADPTPARFTWTQVSGPFKASK